MSKIIYHGSQNIIKAPSFGYGKKYNDYGLGFYCTESLDMAKEWAVGYQRDGYANCYKLEEDNLNTLYLNDEKYCMLHWLALLLKHRHFDVSTTLSKAAKEYILDNFLIDISQYDIIVGYRADDSYFSFAQDFVGGAISYRQLTEAMYLGNLGEQVVMKSQKAFDALEYLNHEYVSADEWYIRRAARDNKARQEYLSSERNIYIKGDLYITTILDEEMKADDRRLR